jgi:hypothetical protein
MKFTVAAVLLLFGLPAVSAHASDLWVCTRIIDNKPIFTEYRIKGDILVINGGRGSSKILENNLDHVISYIAFLSNVHRYPKNTAPIEISEPIYIYIIIEKSSGQLTVLDSGTGTIASDSYGQLIPPSVQTEHCKLG